MRTLSSQNCSNKSWLLLKERFQILCNFLENEQSHRQAVLQKCMANPLHVPCPFVVDNRRLLFDNQTLKSSILGFLLPQLHWRPLLINRQYEQAAPHIGHLIMLKLQRHVLLLDVDSFSPNRCIPLSKFCQIIKNLINFMEFCYSQWYRKSH